MKTKLLLPCILLPLLALSVIPNSRAQGTAFTYQGQLFEGTNPASGTFNLTFSLFNASTGGSQAGTTQTNSSVGVTNGLFTVTIDFGSGAFTGGTNWLQIGVATNGVTNFTALSPRQQVTPTPNAIFATTAGNVSGTVASGSLSGTYSSAVTLNNAGNSFTGTFTGNGGGLTNLAAWQLAGNTGTTGSNFLGTTDNQPLQIRVGGAQAVLITPSNGSPNIVFGTAQNVISNGTAGASILGGSNNVIGTNSSFSLIGGGGQNTISNNADYSVLGGGSQNTIQSSSAYSVLGGGQQNTIDNSANSSFLGAGFLNTIQSGADHSVLGGGYFNKIGTSANMSFLGGGEDNNIQANSQWAFLGGGNQNNIQANAPNAFLGGGQANFIEPGAQYAAIVGGYGNTNTGFYSFIGAGEANGIAAGGQSSFLGGGLGNTIQGQSDYSFIGGGYQNTIQSFVGGAYLATAAFLGGGQGNNVSASWATVAGGYFNNASNIYATVPGGASNVAGGQFSFAAGANAQAVHNGAFVWADAEGTSFASTNANSFNVRANGGARFVTGGAGLTVDGRTVLTNVPLSQLPASVVTNNEPTVSLGTLTLKSNMNFSGGTILIDMSFDDLLYADFSQDNFFAGIDAGVGIFGGDPSLSSPPLGGYSDTGIGNGALESITTGYQNTAIGAYPLQANTTGNNNTAIGFESLYNVAGGSNNIGLGYNAGYNLSSGSNDIYIGNAGSGSESGVMRLGTPGSQANTFIAGIINGDGGGLTNLSAAALPSTVVTNTESGVSFGFLTASTLVVSGNVDLPQPANITSGLTTIVYTDVNGNSYFGADAGLANHANSGSDNTGIGEEALSANSTGSSNIAVGFNAGDNLTSGNNNIYIGNTGQNSESGIIRIGTEGTQTQVFLPGQVLSDSLFTANIFCDGPINTTAAFTCCSIDITGGCDLAEPFPVSKASQEVTEGAVMVIDEKNPGQLKLASQPYDAKVAGVVSGANGINPGIQMQQQGLLDGGRNVALTGRVYVQADACNGAIEPGDLLTTSSSPGRAMKVTEHAKAQGAILGKAMTGLSEGKGMVLVLVTLQ